MKITSVVAFVTSLPLIAPLIANAADDRPNILLIVADDLGYAFVLPGRWKLANVDVPIQESNFAFYDLQADPGETTDPSSEHPERLAEFIDIWRTQRLEFGITLPENL